ncbi:MAG TPA: hypothetical protein PKZ70_06830 [Candidatus Atribacteria bacterium]|nr:hypothetical protein [Candidatus Atribacteria bacterium]
MVKKAKFWPGYQVGSFTESKLIGKLVFLGNERVRQYQRQARIGREIEFQEVLHG